MNATPFGVVKALAVLALLVLLQTTFFRNVRPFGVAPDLVMLAVILAARWLPAEQALVYGFTAGVVMDLLGTTPLGRADLVAIAVCVLGPLLANELTKPVRKTTQAGATETISDDTAIENAGADTLGSSTAEEQIKQEQAA